MASYTTRGMKSFSLDLGDMLRRLPEMENSSVDDYLEYYFQCSRSYGDAFRRGFGIFACIECGEEFRKMWKHPTAGEGRMIRHLRERHKVKELTTARDTKDLLARLKWKRLGRSMIYVCPYCSDFSTGLSVDRHTTMEVHNEIVGHMENLHPPEWKRKTPENDIIEAFPQRMLPKIQGIENRYYTTENTIAKP